MPEAPGVEPFLREAAELVEPYLRALLGRLTAGGEPLQRSMSYVLFAPAKRFRPALALASARAVGGDGKEALPVMASVELLHTYSLIHDDLPCMDDDDLRRGQPSCHKVFGEGMAVLAGDALQALAFEVLSRAAESARDHGRRELRALTLVARAAGPEGMAAGQSLDLAATRRGTGGAPLERAAVEEIHRLKTGALIRAAVTGGALLAGASEDQVAALENYAAALGLAFQAADDLLNEDGDSRLTGKSVGSDRELGKATLPAVVGREEARRSALELAADCRRALIPLGERAAMLAGLAGYAVERVR